MYIRTKDKIQTVYKLLKDEKMENFDIYISCKSITILKYIQMVIPKLSPFSLIQQKSFMMNSLVYYLIFLMLRSCLKCFNYRDYFYIISDPFFDYAQSID